MDTATNPLLPKGSLALALRTPSRFALLHDIPDVRLWAGFGLRAPLLVYAPEGQQLPMYDQDKPPQEQRLYITSLADLSGRRETQCQMTPDQWTWPQKSDVGSAAITQAGNDLARRFVAVCRALDAQTEWDPSSSFQRYLNTLERDRYEASAWFERDRMHLRLRDQVLDRDIVDMWDDDVAEALESGLLTSPRRPRPSDADWLPHLLDYADEQGLRVALRTPAAAPRQRPASVSA